MVLSWSPRITKGKTPLSLAAWDGHEATVKMLLENGVELESKDNENKTPLWLATENGQEMVAELLLEKGVDVNTSLRVKNGEDYFKGTVLHLAVIEGRTL